MTLCPSVYLGALSEFSQSVSGLLFFFFFFGRFVFSESLKQGFLDHFGQRLGADFVDPNQLCVLRLFM